MASAKKRRAVQRRRHCVVCYGGHRICFFDGSSPLTTMKPYGQDLWNGCGPAALKILFSHFGKRVSEWRLAEYCGTTKDGTDHAGLIRAATHFRALVFEKTHGTLAEVCWFLYVAKLPVLVGWWSLHSDPPGEHFSVAFHVTRRDVFLLDPEHGKVRVMPRDTFIHQWHDYDTSISRHYQRWYMVVSFDAQRAYPFAGCYHVPP